jgi:Zinc knuckle
MALTLRHKPQTIGLGLNPNNYPQWGNNMYMPPMNAGGNRVSNVGSNIVCYKCGQPGHMHPNCPRLKGNVHATAVWHDATPPMVGDPPSGPPPMEEEQEGVEDDLKDHPTIKESAASDAMCFLKQVLPPNRRKAGQLNTSAVSVDKSAEPVYHHRSHQKSAAPPDRPCIDNSTISGFWEINGTHAHCLLDSGSKGIMISPEFAPATGMKTFVLEQPIALQLACVGSRSTINYGTHAIIKFGDCDIEEYFDIMNVEYYNVILVTPFLQRMGICLDFNGPGQIMMGMTVVPTNQEHLNDVPQAPMKGASVVSH